MSDLNHHDEEEYHFDDSENFDFGEHDASAEEEFVGDEEVIEDTEAKAWNNERPDAVSRKKPLPNKKIIMVAGVVILLLVGYFIMPRNKTPAKTAIPTATAPREMAKAKPAAMSPAPTTTESNNGVPTSQNTTSTAEDAATANSSNTALDNATNGAWLNTDNSTPPTSSNTQATTAAAPEEGIPVAQPNAPDETNLPMQVQTLNQENQTLTLKLQQVTAQSEATAARAKNLEKVVEQLQVQIKQMAQKSPPPLQRPQSEMAAEPLSAMPRSNAESNDSNTPLVYYVQAIIPGRAWIADSNGRIITVTQGDRVEVLNSTVKNIDPINGIVTMSNGRQIEYGMVAQ
jgi:intracellular multiplication protein IcmG